ncbi:hypothetical protein A2U01_0099957, partial [Trifolium medium]|nr:hypothetical protein [Trifolium medium]
MPLFRVLKIGVLQNLPKDVKNVKDMLVFTEYLPKDVKNVKDMLVFTEYHGHLE